MPAGGVATVNRMDYRHYLKVFVTEDEPKIIIAGK